MQTWRRDRQSFMTMRCCSREVSLPATRASCSRRATSADSLSALTILRDVWLSAPASLSPLLLECKMPLGGQTHVSQSRCGDHKTCWTEQRGGRHCTYGAVMLAQGFQGLLGIAANSPQSERRLLANLFCSVRPSPRQLKARAGSCRLLHRRSVIRSSLHSFGRSLKHAEAALLSKASGEPSAAGFPQFHRARQLLSCTALNCKWAGKRQDFEDAAETEKSG